LIDTILALCMSSRNTGRVADWPIGSTKSRVAKTFDFAIWAASAFCRVGSFRLPVVLPSACWEGTGTIVMWRS